MPNGDRKAWQVDLEYDHGGGPTDGPKPPSKQLLQFGGGLAVGAVAITGALVFMSGNMSDSTFDTLVVVNVMVYLLAVILAIMSFTIPPRPTGRIKGTIIEIEPPDHPTPEQ